MARRRKLTIFLLVITCIASLLYLRREMLFQQAKEMIRQKLEQSFPCQLSIQKIRPRLFYGLALEGLEIRFPQVAGLAIQMKVEQAYVDYNLHRQQQDSSAGDFTLDLEGAEIYLESQSPIVKNLQGQLILTQNELHFKDIQAAVYDNPAQDLKINGELKQDSLSLVINLEHLQIKDYDILTNLSLSLNKKIDLQNQDTKIVGSLKTYGSVLNNQPFFELNSVFDIKDSQLRIRSLSLGDNYDLRGIIELNRPWPVDLSLNFYQADLQQLIAHFAQLDFSGVFNGLIRIKGQLLEPKIDGYLEAKRGHVGEIDFVSADVSIKGQYPKLVSFNSHLHREENSFVVEGEMDFSNIEKGNLLDLRFDTEKGFFWQGWGISHGGDQDNQVHMSKNIADDFKITFDSFVDQQADSLGDSYINELGLEYRIFGDKLLKLRLREEEEILGIERRIKF